MSTRFLSQVVAAAKAGHAVDGIVADKALLELDAIQHAATEWVISDVGELSEPATTTLVRIAEEATTAQEPAPGESP